jgi:hypothetical protein
MSKIVKEISCIVGEYTNSQGEKKKRYQRIGSVIETKNGPMLKLDVIPLREGGWDGWAYMNDPRPQEDQPRRQASGFSDMSDDMPF